MGLVFNERCNLIDDFILTSLGSGWTPLYAQTRGYCYKNKDALESWSVLDEFIRKTR